MTEEERDAQYGSAETAKTYAGLIEAVNIFAKYTKEGLGKKYAVQSGHDIIYFYTSEPIAEESEDGVRLNQLGFFFWTKTLSPGGISHDRPNTIRR